MISKASDACPKRRRRLVKNTIIETPLFLLPLLKDVMTQQAQGAISLQSLPQQLPFFLVEQPGLTYDKAAAMGGFEFRNLLSHQRVEMLFPVFLQKLRSLPFHPNIRTLLRLGNQSGDVRIVAAYTKGLLAFTKGQQGPEFFCRFRQQTPILFALYVLVGRYPKLGLFRMTCRAEFVWPPFQ
jgi:hypothetical protein